MPGKRRAGVMIGKGQVGAWRFLNRVGDRVSFHRTLTQCLPNALAAGAGRLLWLCGVVARLGTQEAAQMAEHPASADDFADSGM